MRARSASVMSTHAWRIASYLVDGIMETPAEVNPIAILPSLRLHRKSTSKRYGRRMLRSSRDIVWRYTHSEPPSLPKATPPVPPFVFSAMERLVSEAMPTRRMTACTPSSCRESRIAPNSSSGFNAINAGFSSNAMSICAASARVTVSSVGSLPIRALRSNHELTAAKRLRLPSMFNARNDAENGNVESHAKK